MISLDKKRFSRDEKNKLYNALTAYTSVITGTGNYSKPVARQAIHKWNLVLKALKQEDEALNENLAIQTVEATELMSMPLVTLNLSPLPILNVVYH